MTPITHRNREIERLERELAESREEVRRLLHVIEQATHYSKVELPRMSETAQLSWLQSMRGHILDILLTPKADDE